MEEFYLRGKVMSQRFPDNSGTQREEIEMLAFLSTHPTVSIVTLMDNFDQGKYRGRSHKFREAYWSLVSKGKVSFDAKGIVTLRR